MRCGMVVFKAAMLAVLLSGCTVYGSRLTVQPKPSADRAVPPRLSSEDESAAQEIVSQIAAKYELAVVPGPYDDDFTEPYRGLPLFKGRGAQRDVALGAMVHQDGSEIVFTLTDQAHGEATATTLAIEHDLDTAVARRFPQCTLRWDRSSAPRSPLAP